MRVLRFVHKWLSRIWRSELVPNREINSHKWESKLEMLSSLSHGINVGGT
jgi:hypothetical protein